MTRRSQAGAPDEQESAVEASSEQPGNVTMVTPPNAANVTGARSGSGIDRDVPLVRSEQDVGDGRLLQVFDLTVLSILAVFLAAMTFVLFASVQHQQAVNQYTLAGLPLTVWHLDELDNQRRLVEESMTSYQTELAQRDSDVAAGTADVANQMNLIIFSEEQIGELLRIAATIVQVYDPEFQLGDTIAGVILADIRGRAYDDQQLSRLLDQIQMAVDQLTAQKSQLAVLEADLERLQSERTNIQAQIDKLRQSNLDFAVTNRDGAVGTQIVNLLPEYRALTSWSFIGLQPFKTALSLPREFAIMTLVAVAGVLGSVLYIIANFDNWFRRLSWSSRFLRPFLGGITAFALYILVKGGVLVVGGASPIAEAGLSPYFISFVALIGGFMSENALGALTSIGRSFLSSSSSDSVIRYARAVLSDRLTELGTTQEDLRRFLPEFTTQELAEILGGTRGVDHATQTVIAAFVNTEPRELFSDVPAHPSP